MKLSRGKSLLINLALMACSLLVCLGGFEGVAWAWERGQARGPYAWELVASRRIRLDRFETPGAGYTLMRSGTTYAWQDIPVHINTRGLRGPELDREKPPGVVRILNLGDSVVFGWGVRYEDTYGYQLQQLLNQSHSDGGTTYEVINAGAPGWNTENALAYLQAEGLVYQPDLILLNFTVANDVYGKSALESTSSESLIDWLRGHTYFWPFLSVQYHLLEVRSGKSKAIPVLNPPREAISYFPVQEDAPQWDVVWEPIRGIATLTDEYGCDFLLIILPTAFQVEDMGYPEVPQQALLRRAGEEGIDVLDLLPVFREACREAPPGEICGPEGRYLWADMWMHPSAVGHQLIAERIINLVEAEGWYLAGDMEPKKDGEEKANE